MRTIQTKLIVLSVAAIACIVCFAGLFLTAMTSVYAADNLGYLWISVEATTLMSAPLVYFTRTKYALEASWKYLIICSVGIAFALFGTTFVFASGQYAILAGGSLNVSDLIHNAKLLDYPLFKIGFIFFVMDIFKTY